RSQQKEIAKKYLADGDEPAAPLSAVAAHIRAEFKIAQVGSPEAPLVKKMHDKVLETPVPAGDEEQEDLSAVLFSENPPDADTRADIAFKAMDQWGTDEDAVYRALAGLTEPQSRLLQAIYERKKGRNLADHIDSEFSGSEFKRAMALLDSKPVEAAAAAIQYARPLLGGPASKDDRAAMLEAIRTLPPGKAGQLASAFKAQTGDDLDDALKESMRDYKQAEDGSFNPDERGFEES